MKRAALLLVLLACAAPDRPETGLAVFVGGEERGYLEPCGCTRPQLGGLARKATAVRGGILLENGDLVAGGGRLNEIKFETFLLALSEIGCRAVNVGEGELGLGLEFLRSASALASFPLLSANLRDSDGRPVFAAHADVAGFRIVGLIDPALARGHRTADPEASLADALSTAPKAARIILLYHGPETAARRLAARFPRIETTIFAHGDGEPAVRSPSLVTPGDRARWMIRIGRRPAVATLGEKFADDPRMARSLREYVRRITEEDLLHRMNPGVEPAGGGYVGDAACAKCHREADEIHGKSRHARAIDSLAKTGREVDPDCVGCHVVGYGERTGFTSAKETPDLARVGCESCHGAGAEHRKNPEEVRTTGASRESCVRCHTPDTDPGFRFDGKWPGIRHR